MEQMMVMMMAEGENSLAGRRVLLAIDYISRVIIDCAVVVVVRMKVRTMPPTKTARKSKPRENQNQPTYLLYIRHITVYAYICRHVCRKSLLVPNLSLSKPSLLYRSRLYR
jgi:hypothetical protein